MFICQTVTETLDFENGNRNPANVKPLM